MLLPRFIDITSTVVHNACVRIHVVNRRKCRRFIVWRPAVQVVFSALLERNFLKVAGSIPMVDNFRTVTEPM